MLDPYFSRVWTKVHNGLHRDFTLQNGFLFRENQLCIPDCSVRLRILEQLHSERHVGRDRTLQLASTSYFSSTLRRDVERYIEHFLACQQAKGKASNAGFYIFLPISTQPWTDISMDFVLGLPCTQRGNDSIFVIIDLFSKMDYYVPCKRRTDAVQVAQIFVREIYRLHGLPFSIFSNWDTRFLSHLSHSVWKLLHTSLDISSSYHPQTNGHTDTNRALGNMLRNLVGDNIKSWNSMLAQAEFAHNHDNKRSLGFSPFKVIYGIVPRGCLGLLTALDKTRLHGQTLNFVEDYSSSISKHNEI